MRQASACLLRLRAGRALLGERCGPARQPPDARAGALRRQAVIPAALLKDYIAYARARCQPELSPAAATDLIQGYCEMRRLGTSRKARPRPVGSLGGAPPLRRGMLSLAMRPPGLLARADQVGRCPSCRARRGRWRGMRTGWLTRGICGHSPVWEHHVQACAAPSLGPRQAYLGPHVTAQHAAGDDGDAAAAQVLSVL